MKSYTCSALLMLMVFAASGKSNDDLVKANYLYTHLAYHEAIGYYQKSANTNDPVVLARIADCYRLTRDLQQANAWYAKAVATTGYPEDTKLHYGQTLMGTGDYTQALTQLRDYQKANPNDRRAANLIASCEQIGKMKAQMPVGNIMLMPFNSDKSEFGPSLRKNELFFTADTVEKKGTSKTDNWTGNPFCQIYRVSCGSANVCTSTRELAGKANKKYHDGPCTFNADGSVMYFTRTNYDQTFLTKSPIPDKNDVVHLEIMIGSDYDEAGGKYKKLTSFKYNNKNYSTAHPAISKDGNLLVFVSDMPGGQGGTDIYVCEKNANGTWADPKNADLHVNTEGDELFPFIDKDNTLYFASNGRVGFGGLDIYKANWNKDTHTFSDAENMGMPLNSSYDDMSLVMTDDGSMGYFASDRPAVKKEDNIYSFTPQSLFLSITGIDSTTNLPIPNFNVVLHSTNISDTLTASTNGKILTPLFPQVLYSGTATAFNYHPKEIEIAGTSTTKKTDTIYSTIKLSPINNISYQVMVYDAATRRPIEDPMIVFRKAGDMGADSIKLNTGVPYATALDAGNTYHVFAIKENYYGNEKVISTKGIKPQSGGVKITDTIFMKKLQVGEVYNIENVYYDYDKANIRADAKPSLEQLITILNKYPNMHIQINSHTDCRGKDSYNLKLSDARAKSVITYLHERGIATDRLRYKGYGETKPIYKCANCEQCTENEHQANRRTEFMIMAM